MPSTYSLDLRTRVLNDCLAGLTCTNVARKYSVSRIWGHNLKKQYKETGSIEPKKYKREQKRKLVAEHPDATLVELHALLPTQEQVSINTLHNYL